MICGGKRHAGGQACAGMIVLLLAGAAAAQVWSLPSAGTEGAPARAQTRGMTIVLPPRVVAGEQGTLAVLDAAGRLTPEAVVELTGGEQVTTDVTGRAAFTAPGAVGVLLARFPGRGASASTTIIVLPSNPPDGLQLSDYPHVVSVSDRFAVNGFGFRGAADGNRVLLGDRPALVLAASPVSLVVLPGPRSPVGPTQLVIEVGGRSPGPVPVTLVSLQVQFPAKRLAQGEKGTLLVRARGSQQRLVIEARNLSPEIVELPRGNVQRVATSGGPYNFAVIELLGVQPGDFSVSLRLVPGVVGLPNTEAARQHLLAARKLATGQWQERLDRVIRRIERDPQDFLRVRTELEKMLAEKPEGELAQRIEAAWKELLKR